MRTPILMLALAAASCAPTAADTARTLDRQAAGEAKLQRALAGLTPGQPLTCIPTFERTHTESYGGTILYRVNRGLVYRNDTGGGCEGLARDDIAVSVEYSGRPCQGDIVRLIDRTLRTPTGSCALGPFVPYRRAR